MTEKKYKAVFKRVETDREFQTRLRETAGYWTFATGETLDNEAWSARKMQRRLVEDVA